MSESHPCPPSKSAGGTGPGSNESLHRLRGLSLCVVLLLLVFSRPLLNLAGFAIGNELYSYIVLVPFISLYFVWIKRRKLPPDSGPALVRAGVFAGAGLTILACQWLVVLPEGESGRVDSLALAMLAFVLLLLAVCAWFLGKERLRALAFPLGFLVFLTPLPDFLTRWVESFLQFGSAAVAYLLFLAAGTGFLYHDLVFQLPGINLEIAPECSGIHSSLVLLITSLLASHLFLRTPWKKAVLVLAVIPLALLRNGFRVFVIGELCIHVGPEMIDSPIHRKGGPLFFALSLIPFFALLLFFAKSDRRNAATKSQNPGT